MPDHPIDGAQPYFGDTVEPILEDIGRVLASGQLTQGEHLKAFERQFADYVGAGHALGVNSCGAALELGLQALDVAGKEVIVPTNTFVGSATAVARAGGTPVFADNRLDTLCLDIDDVRRKITERTAGIMMVHMFGLIQPDYHELRELCRERGMFLMEDAAHAHGAAIDGVMAGDLGDVACFSFYPTKIMTTGEGGMLTTSRQDIYEKVTSLRNYGRNLVGTDYVSVSTNYRMAEIPAILGRHQMSILPEIIKRRQTIVAMYREGLSGVIGLTLLPAFSGIVHPYWRFAAYLDSGIDRVALQTAMRDNHGVRITWMYEPLCHLQPVFKDRYGYKKGDFPVAEECIERMICLPTHGGMSDDDVRRVITGLTEELSRLERARG